MATLNQLILVCLAYVVVLFAVAFAAERAAQRGQGGWVRSPIIYTLSLSIYCTGWTFFGAVGYAARSGLEFVTIYLGPSLVMIGWWWVLRKLVRIGRALRVTSIADLISSRFGKSNSLGVVITLLAVIGVTPYIALQLQSVVLALRVFAEAEPGRTVPLETVSAAFWVACGAALFTILFGTRSLNASERQHGIVTAIAIEGIVKLVALVSVGAFVVWGLSGGIGPTLERIDASPIGQWQVAPSRWFTITFLSAVAFLCLPRMFQVLVVENDDDRQLSLASWAFPLYLLVMSLFIVPIAVVGLDVLPPGSNPDLFVLSLPLDQGYPILAKLSFLGGFSSATSMVIVATLALSTMVSNHIVMPIYLARQGDEVSVFGDVRHVVLLSRRLSVVLIITLGFLYYRMSGGGAALAAIGLISFAGVAQFLPALIGGLFWRGATRAGALSGLLIGFALWAWTMLLPGFGAGMFNADVLAHGPFGIGWLRPQALFGLAGMDPTVHAVWWSLSVNALTFVAVSVLTFPNPMERLQSAQIVNIDQHSDAPQGWTTSAAKAEDLMIMAQRLLGVEDAHAFFATEAARQGRDSVDPTPDFLQRLERELAGSVGTTTAHAMVSQIAGGPGMSVRDLMALADESAQILEYSGRLEAQSAELERTAAKLRQANTKLTQLSKQKDTFLSQISHELRTPMTSIRAFSQILRDTDAMGPEDQTRYASIIHDESLRLSRLLDDLLDLSVLENGQVTLNRAKGRLHDVLDRAVQAVSPEDLQILRGAGEDIHIESDLDRLTQVFINLISNAAKYCDVPDPTLTISVQQAPGALQIDFQDNGSGIAAENQSLIFEKFARINHDDGAGAGLGLAISVEIMTKLGGSLDFVPTPKGVLFRVQMPLILDAVS